MTTLTFNEKQHLENLFEMECGYVLNFSNRTFKRFFEETVGINIDDPKYCINGGSKANKLRSFLVLESDSLVAKVLWELLRYRKQSSPNSTISDDFCMQIIDHLNSNKDINFDFIKYLEKITEDTIKECIDSLIDNVEKGKPVVALDRLHTLFCSVLNKLIKQKKDEEIPLQSIYGKYIKTLNVENEVGEILKANIRVLEKLNDIRNNKSLAHANPLLQDNDSALYIIRSMHSLLEFLIKKSVQ